MVRDAPCTMERLLETRYSQVQRPDAESPSTQCLEAPKKLHFTLSMDSEVRISGWACGKTHSMGVTG